MSLPDYSAWLTEERLEKEEIAWADSKLYLTHVAHIFLLSSSFPIQNVVEVGCGTGWIPTRLPLHFNYVGFDKNEKVLEIAKTKNIPSRLFMRGDIRDLTTDLVSSLMAPDLVCGFAVLKHFSLDEWDSIFDRIVSLAPLGLFTMNVADENRDDGIEFHHSWITKERLFQALQRNGKKLLHSTVAWRGETWEKKTGEEWIFSVGGV